MRIAAADGDLSERERNVLVGATELSGLAIARRLFALVNALRIRWS
jgi:hypothetical protein